MRLAYKLVVWPLDSFRYFELDFVVKRCSSLQPRRYLDLSSPRFLPASLSQILRCEEAVLVNPDADDLRKTQETIKSMGLTQEFRYDGRLVIDLDYETESFDLITSVSVIEHIPEDTAAINALWSLIKPGGRLMITVPCAAEKYQELTNIDEYKLLHANPDGLVFWQRFYDLEALKSRIFLVTGEPVYQEIFGEIQAGHYDSNVLAKRTSHAYPVWAEPLMMAKRYRRYESIDEMPGMGVVAMEFVKRSTK
ncbi:MAG: methyltransferase domain-containing protein [Planctomycetales bacterium]|nr:methyltransferase domain-containing protein [Planctomycetales bacterium]